MNSIEKNPDFKLSPSLCHNELLEAAPLQLRYDPEKFQSVSEWQQELRPKLVDLTGLDRIEASDDQQIRSLWKQDDENGTIEKIVFTSEPNADIPAYICLPNNAEPPYTWYVCVQGHSTGMHNSIGRDYEDEQKSIAVEGDRDFAIGCMKRGIAALCIEQRAFGYRKEAHQKMPAGGCQDASVHALMLGRTLIGERVFDVAQGIRLLNNRDDVRMDRIGITGNSGGGTISLFASALVPEIAFSMPSCYFCTFKASIMSLGHCVCNYVPRILDYAEMADVLGLFAPKPLVILSGKEDNIFPIEGVHEAFDVLKTIYRAAGAEGNCTLVVGEEGHRYYAEQGWNAMFPYMQR